MAIERQREILNWLSDRGRAWVADPALKFDGIEETIRRDLDKLEQEGRPVRSHDRAVAQESKETPHWQREYVNLPEKEAIAREAAREIHAGDTLILDASSTLWFLAKRLPEAPLTVIANSLHIALTLGGPPQSKVTMPGGTLAPNSMSSVGSETQWSLRRYHAGLLFLSCRGIDGQRGASDVIEEQAMARRVMMEISDRRILMMDSSNFGVRALSIVAPTPLFTRFIADNQAPEDACRAFEEMGLPVTRAEVY